MSSLFSKSDAPLSSRTSVGVADIIRREIFAGTLQPEQPLLERDIASELGVSRTPVREALFALQGEGLVELVPRRNARVRKMRAGARSTHRRHSICPLRPPMTGLDAHPLVPVPESLDDEYRCGKACTGNRPDLFAPAAAGARVARAVR